MSNEEKSPLALKIAYAGQYEQEKAILEKWRPIPRRKAKFMKRTFQVERWIEDHGWCTDEEILRYCEQHFLVTRDGAKAYLKQVINDFKKRGIPVITQ